MSQVDVVSRARVPVGLIVVWALFGFHRVDFVEAIHDAVGNRDPESQGFWGGIQIATAIAFILVMGLLKKRSDKYDDSENHYWGWWWIGSLIAVAVQLAFVVLEDRRSGWPIWVDVVGGAIHFIGMTLLLLASLNADPATLQSHAKRANLPRDWERVQSVIPIAIGIVAVIFAEILWFDARLNGRAAAEGVVKEDFFHEVLTFIPILLIPLGLELNFFRRREAVHRRQPGQKLPDPFLRAAPMVTGVLMVLAIVLAASTLTYDHNTAWGAWHVYSAFVISVQAASTGLATVVWLLFVAVPERG